MVLRASYCHRSLIGVIRRERHTARCSNRHYSSRYVLFLLFDVIDFRYGPSFSHIWAVQVTLSCRPPFVLLVDLFQMSLILALFWFYHGVGGQQPDDPLHAIFNCTKLRIETILRFFIQVWP